MDNNYSEKILKQLTAIKFYLILSALAFAIIEINYILAMILFSLLICMSVYRLMIIKICVQELSAYNLKKHEIKVKEKTLINCYNDIKLKEKDYFANEPVETIDKTVTANDEIKENDKNKEVLNEEFNYVMDEELTKETVDEQKENVNTNKPIEKDINDAVEKEIEKETVIDEQEHKEEVIDLSKCIRKLPKGRKASDKAIELAKQYGYELKEGETFVSPRKNK